MSPAALLKHAAPTIAVLALTVAACWTFTQAASASLDSPPSAALSVLPASGVAPLSVTADSSQSTDADGTPIASYTFDFGDGTLVGPQPMATGTHVYGAVGGYTLRVVVTDSAGLSASATGFVIARLNLVGNPGFETDSSGWNTAGIAGVTLARVSGGHSGSWSVQLTNSGTTPASCILNDSPNWVGKTVAATYAGSIWARADTAGAAVKLKFREYSGSALVGSGTTSATLTTAWQQVSVSYVPAAPGSSSLDLQAFVSNAPVGTCFYADDAAIAAVMDAPLAALTVSPAAGVVPLQVTADASHSTDPDSTPIASYSFDFGDGTLAGPQSAPTAGHSYSAPGTYAVSAIATDAGGLASTTTSTVTVDSLVAALNLSYWNGLSQIASSTGPAPLDVLADGSGSIDTDSSPIYKYTFDFGDGTVITQVAKWVEHIYQRIGTYTVTLTLIDTKGFLSKTTGSVTVLDRPPFPVLTLSNYAGLIPLTVTADASRSTDLDGTSIASYTFDFGDGSVVGPQSAATATHMFTTPGRYDPSVTVTDTAGLSSVARSIPPCTRDGCAPLTVDALTAALRVSPSSGPAPLPVTADASGSTDADSTPIASYTFYFGDGTTVGPQPSAIATHTYSAAGNYRVAVAVIDSDPVFRFFAMAISPVTVADSPPRAVVELTPTAGPAPLTITLDASGSTDPDSTGIASYAFDFGDGTMAVIQSSATATHTYSAVGNYTITVTVTDTGGLSTAATAAVLVGANLVGNPGFENSTSGWNTAGLTGITLSRAPGGHSGSWSAQLANAGAGPQSCVLNDSPNWVSKTLAGKSYYGSIWVRADTAGASLKVQFREYNGSILVGSALRTVSLTTSWQLLTVSYTPAMGGASTLDFQAYLPNAAVGTCFYADDVGIISS